MLGPGLLMGRIAARDVVTRLKSRRDELLRVPILNQGLAGARPSDSDPEWLRAWREVLRQLIAQPRPGYMHFEKVHGVVLDRNYDCARCHREPSPLALNAEQLDRHGLIQACVICHGTAKE